MPIFDLQEQIGGAKKKSTKKPSTTTKRPKSKSRSRSKSKEKTGSGGFGDDDVDDADYPRKSKPPSRTSSRSSSKTRREYPSGRRPRTSTNNTYLYEESRGRGPRSASKECDTKIKRVSYKKDE